MPCWTRSEAAHAALPREYLDSQVRTGGESWQFGKDLGGMRQLQVVGSRGETLTPSGRAPTAHGVAGQRVTTGPLRNSRQSAAGEAPGPEAAGQGGRSPQHTEGGRGRLPRKQLSRVSLGQACEAVSRSFAKLLFASLCCPLEAKSEFFCWLSWIKASKATAGDLEFSDMIKIRGPQLDRSICKLHSNAQK